MAAQARVWRAPGANMNHWATPVLDNGYLYGVYGQAQSGATMRCVEFKTGMEKWRQFGVGLGGVLFTTGHVLVLTENGYLLLVKPDPTAYVEVARFRALDGSQGSFPNLVRCWNVPAISNGRIYARSTTEAVCLDVADAAPQLKLNPALLSAGGTFRIFIGNEDGSPLDTNRVANIDILASTDLTLGLSGWIKLTNPIVVTNGQLQLDEPQSSNTTRRFFRVEERP